MSDTPDTSAWFAELERLHDRQAAIDAAYISLRDAGLLPKVTLHKYMCRRGCPIATVFRVAHLTLCVVRDYKFSPGLNREVSVPSARRKNTLDGERHWPGHVYDVEELDRFSAGASRAGMGMNCRHHRGTVLAQDVLATVAGVSPGRPGPPTRL